MSRVVCLLTAGLGVRMGRYAELTNKSLLPVRGKAIISHIIDQFPNDTEFIVSIGYKHDAVQTYLSWAHPHRRFVYVPVDNYAGPGSGPAYSVRQCAADIANREFTLIVCDGYYDCLTSLPQGQNAVGVARVSPALHSTYCNVEITNGRVTAFYDKQAGPATAHTLCGVYQIADPTTFFSALTPPELSSGLAALSLTATELQWRDLGTEAHYDKFLQEQFGDTAFDYSKTDELLYTVAVPNESSRVIKYFKDSAITEHRVLRAQGRNYFPVIQAHHAGFYWYPFVAGHTLYTRGHFDTFVRLLDWMESVVWPSYPSDVQLTTDDCWAFYYTKTHARIDQFYRKYPNYTSVEINGQSVTESIEHALQKIPWPALCQQALSQRTAFIHGDFQFDNILLTEDNKFLLLDWRQDFAGHLWHGDKYYDIAKLKAGLLLNHDLIKRNTFVFESVNGIVRYDYPVRQSHAGYVTELTRRYPDPLIDEIVTLIFLNMAPLHKPPYDQLLFNLAWRRLLQHT